MRQRDRDRGADHQVISPLAQICDYFVSFSISGVVPETNVPTIMGGARKVRSNCGMTLYPKVPEFPPCPASSLVRPTTIACDPDIRSRQIEAPSVTVM